jgi:hypothetical protein
LSLALPGSLITSALTPSPVVPAGRWLPRIAFTGKRGDAVESVALRAKGSWAIGSSGSP